MPSKMETASKLNKRLRDPEESTSGRSTKRTHTMVTRSRKAYLEANPIPVETEATVETNVYFDENYPEKKKKDADEDGYEGEYSSDDESNEDEDKNEDDDDEPDDDDWKTFDFEEVHRTIVYMSGYHRSFGQRYYEPPTRAQVKGFVEFFARVVRKKLNISRPSILDPPASTDERYIDPSYCIWEWHSEDHNPSDTTNESRSRGDDVGEELFGQAMRYTISAQILVAMIEWLEMKRMQLRKQRQSASRFDEDAKKAQAKDYHFMGSVKHALEDLHVRQSQFESAVLQEVAGLDTDDEEEDSDSD